MQYFQDNRPCINAPISTALSSQDWFVVEQVSQDNYIWRSRTTALGIELKLKLTSLNDWKRTQGILYSFLRSKNISAIYIINNSTHKKEPLWIFCMTSMDFCTGYQNWKRLELFEWEYYVIGTCKIPFIINLIQSTFGAESITVCFFEIWLF